MEQAICEIREKIGKMEQAICEIPENIGQNGTWNM